MFQYLSQLVRHRRGIPAVRRRRSVRLTIDALEERWAPAVLTVNSLADNASRDSVLTLREAIQVVDGTLGRSLSANEQAQITGTLGTNDTIHFNLPTGPQTITLTNGALSITKPVTISGPGSNSLTINGNNHDRVFVIGRIFSQSLSLGVGISGLTISGGNQTYGGGLLNFGTLTVSNTTFANNTAGSSGGGGIYNDGALTANGCTFSANAVSNLGAGAGIDNISAGTATLTNCTFTGNTANGSGSNASSGGGIANSGTMTVSNSTFTGNKAASNGGGIYNNGVLTVNNSTFLNNTASSDGGGIRSSSTLMVNGSTFTGNSTVSEGGAIDGTGSAKLIVINSTLANNTAGSRGGALKIQGTTSVITNSTITGNRVTTGSSGLFGGGLYNTSPVVLHNTIVAGNVQGPAPGTTANDIYGSVDSSSSFNLIGTGGSGGLVNGVNNNQVGVSNPGLGTLANNGGPTLTVALLPGSPAIDQGSNAFVNPGETDQRGLTRIVNGAVDLGAVEIQTTSVPPGDQSATVNTSTPIMLGSFTDANSAAGPWTVNVNWGDGSTPTTFTTTTQGSLAAQSHSYPSAGTVTVTVTVTDVNHDSSTAAFHVSVGTAVQTATSFVVTGFPTPIMAGVAGMFTVTAKDSSGNTVPGYTGTVHFTSSDPHAQLPADYMFTSSDKGSHTFSATLKTTGTQSVTATDTGKATLTGTQSGITVNPSSSPAVLTVNSLADNTTADNFLTLREATELEDGTLGRALTPGEQAQIFGTLGNTDTIQFSLPSGAQTITLTGGALSITHPVTILGPGAGSLTINGNNLDRVFVIGQIFSQNLSLSVAISGLTISGGNQTYGGGLLNFGTLTVSNTTFANNTAGSSGGGGIYNDGALTANGCTFSGNTVSSLGAGGGLENLSSGTVILTNCTFTGNTANGSGTNASSGAGLANSGVMTVSNSTFTANTAASDGGAIYNDGNLTMSTSSLMNNTALSDGGGIRSGGTLTLQTSTFAGNSAASVGGGLDSSDMTLLVTNCTFANNTAISMGGAMETDPGTGAASLINDTLTGNRVTVGSGGIFGGGLYSGRPTTLHNTIVAGNFQGPAPSTTPSDIAGTLDSSSSFNLIGTGGSGGLVNGVNNNQVGVSNPGLGTLTNNGGPTLTVALLSGSPAIDQGSNAFVSSGETDQRGFSRIVNGIVDLGAFELQ